MSVRDLEELYRATAPEVFAYLRRRGATDPEDLAAEVYAIAWRRRADLPSTFLRRAWLFGTARNLLLADARRRGRERAIVEQEAGGHADQPESRDEVRVRVSAALARLSPDDQELILLVEWERMTPAEIAVVLGTRPGTVRVRLHRVRRVLAADPDLLTLLGPNHPSADPPPISSASPTARATSRSGPARSSGHLRPRP